MKNYWKDVDSGMSESILFLSHKIEEVQEALRNLEKWIEQLHDIDY